MQFSVSVASAILALASSVLAQTAGFDAINKPLMNEVLHVGQTYIIEWDAPAQYQSDVVSISLIGGATQDTQTPIMDIAAGVANSAGSYGWVIGSDVGTEAVYGLVIKSTADPTVFQYSNPFQIVAGAAGSATGYGYSATTGSTTTVTMTTVIGTKTVTIKPTSTCTTSTTTMARNTTTSCTTSTTTMAYNSTTLCRTSSAYVSSSAPVYVSTTAYVAPTTTTPVTVPSAKGAASHLGASSMALVGAIVMAFVAL